MRKYIVEIEDPKAGQVVSTGGIRKNGKMAAQFKNPVPYRGNEVSATTGKNTTGVPTYRLSSHPIKERIINEAQDMAVEVSRDFIGMLWYNLGKPLISDFLNQATEWMFSPQHSTRIAALDIDFTENDDKDEAIRESSHNVIQYPNKWVV